MKNRWSDADSRQYCDRYAPRWGEALALRVYTSRLIGVEADLVMHGGGNTSVKIARENLLGDRVDALCVKGSGWDLDSIDRAAVQKLADLYANKGIVTKPISTAELYASQPK